VEEPSDGLAAKSFERGRRARSDCLSNMMDTGFYFAGDALRAFKS
jgi:hypothetical protein